MVWKRYFREVDSRVNTPMCYGLSTPDLSAREAALVKGGAVGDQSSIP
jgi:hypothetical protein